jgi:hypothetical protein
VESRPKATGRRGLLTRRRSPGGRPSSRTVRMRRRAWSARCLPRLPGRRGDRAGTGIDATARRRSRRSRAASASDRRDKGPNFPRRRPPVADIRAVSGRVPGARSRERDAAESPWGRPVGVGRSHACPCTRQGAGETPSAKLLNRDRFARARLSCRSTGRRAPSAAHRPESAPEHSRARPAPRRRNARARSRRSPGGRRASSRRYPG